MHQQARSRCARMFDVLSNKPLGKLPRRDSCPRRGRVLVIGRWGMELQRRQIEQALELFDQAWFGNFVAEAFPMIQAANNDRLLRQIEQRARTESGDHLAIANLAVWSRISTRHGAAPSGL